MLIVMLAATALLADAAPAAAAPAKAPPAAKPVADQIVCHKEFTVGSNIPRKVCRSKADDELNRAEARKELEQMQLATPGFHN